MEKKEPSMLTEDQKKRIFAETQRFLEMTLEFTLKEAELIKCEEEIASCIEELPRVAEEERQLETAMEVVYREAKEEAKTKAIKGTIEELRKNRETLSDEVDQLRTDLLKQMHNLPIPVDLDNPRKEEPDFVFEYFKDAKFGEQGITVMCKLFRQQCPPRFLDMVFLPDKVIIKNASDKQEALTKLVKGVQSFRMVVDDLSKSYEQIDEMVDRVRRSNLYTSVLMVLFKKHRLSSDGIAKVLSADKRKVYDTCYNLTRSNWSPSPIAIVPSGEWELTLPGEILVNRLLQKYGEPSLAANIESKNANSEKQVKEA